MLTSSPRRIMVTGCCGAGKSTLARQLHQRLPHLPLIHLDQEYWNPGWVETEPDLWRKRVTQLAAQEAWIIDGNYGGTFDIRLACADWVIFLDRSRWVCLRRCINRIIRSYGRTRPDLAPGCPERFDYEFLKYVYNFPVKKRPELLAKLEGVAGVKKVLLLRSDRQVEGFLRTLG